jgi:hypothetical protein
MNKYLNPIILQNNLPRWFVNLNYFCLVPLIVIWPVVFFGSIFMFDHPDNEFTAFLAFIAINCYPVLLIGNMVLSFRLYRKLKPVSIILPLIPVVAIGCVMYMFYVMSGIEC